MFARSLTEKVYWQVKTVINGPLGQTETWVTQGWFWASVAEASSDLGEGWPGKRGKEGTQREYTVLARANKRNWDFKTTRFLWGSTDQDNQRILKPIENIIQPGREYRMWAKIRCWDITNEADPVQG